MKTITITTKCTGSVYTTTTVQGCRGSCTSSPETAVARLAKQLFGPLLTKIERLGTGANLTEEKWAIEALGEPIAWCWASGEIEITAYMPKNTIQIAVGPYEALQNEIAFCIAAHVNGVSELRVPGVAQATTPKSKADAIEAWLSWCAARRTKRITWNISKDKLKAAA